MKYFYVRYEVGEDYPNYVFVIKAETLNKAYKLVDKILMTDYPEEYELNNHYSLCEITPEELLNKLLIN